VSNLKAFTLLAVGYLLMFAAFYNKGQYASSPWGALQA
jgi:hypothetical protein